MKLIRLVLVSVAIILAIGGAFATKQDVCEGFPQYRKLGSMYVPAGDYGTSYVCLNEVGICTYYKPNPSAEVYYPCRTGHYLYIMGVSE